ncbi:MAG: cytosolic protein [Tannerella sp.]|jgi:hypothetical protein|nr:cytosolic protein [Tannerella sp.]
MKIDFKHIINKYLENSIEELQKERLDFLSSISFTDLVRKQDPYLYSIQETQIIYQIIREWINHELLKNEEIIFGAWLKGLAIFINQQVYGGWKSGIKGVDLEFDKDTIRYIVNIKSSPNWGNSEAIGKMKTNFTTAKKTLRTSNSKMVVMAINGCCTGTDNKPDKGDYFKYCGQEFWEFISGNENLYLEIVEPLRHKARERNDDFQKLYSQRINKFTKEFCNEFCNENCGIDWRKLVEFNSGRKKEGNT